MDFRAAENEDPALGSTWGTERTVRASVLRTLLLKVPQEEGEIAALRITGARITGVLDLKYATIDAAVRLSHCHFDGVPELYGARLRQLNLSKSVLPGLTSAALRARTRSAGKRRAGPGSAVRSSPCSPMHRRTRSTASVTSARGT